MAYLSGEHRDQGWALPQHLDDYVSHDNPVRIVDLFVSQLDLKEAGVPLQPPSTGRPGYDPRDLLKLYLYGYLNRVRSSRELERLTHRNLEVLWLLRRLQPDHKTISEFRREHRKAFKLVLRQFNLICRELKLFGAELVAIDGSHFKAVNSKARNFTQAKLGALLQGVEQGIERYLKELELNDAEAAKADAALGATRAARLKSLPERIKALKEARERYEGWIQKAQQEPTQQVSLTDPDSRLLKKSISKEGVVGYNVQSAVDPAHHLIVDIAATMSPTDVGHLTDVAQRAKEVLGVAQLTVVADGGYHAIDDITAAEANGICVHVPAPADRMEKEGYFPREAFKYDAQRDACICPAGESLLRHQDSQKHGHTYRAYYNMAACAHCALRAQCTKGKYRKIQRAEGAEVLEKVAQRMKDQPEIYAKRKALVEHPFGTLKFWWSQGAFLTRGLEAVDAEISLSALAYNLKRALQVLGQPALLNHLRA